MTDERVTVWIRARSLVTSQTGAWDKIPADPTRSVQMVPASSLEALKAEKDDLTDALSGPGGAYSTILDQKNRIDALEAENERLREAVTAFVAWLDHDDSSPDYGSLTRDTHPDGEAIWSEWWNRGLGLCDRAVNLGRAALAKESGS